MAERLLKKDSPALDLWTGEAWHCSQKGMLAGIFPQPLSISKHIEDSWRLTEERAKGGTFSTPQSVRHFHHIRRQKRRQFSFGVAAGHGVLPCAPFVPATVPEWRGAAKA